MNKTVFTALIILASLVPTIADAQPGRGGFRGPSLSELELGREFPDVTAFDEDGKEFSIKSLRGKHVVLVFGCLT